MTERRKKKGFLTKYDSLENVPLEERKKLAYKLQIAKNLLDLFSEKLR